MAGAPLWSDVLSPGLSPSIGEPEMDLRLVTMPSLDPPGEARENPPCRCPSSHGEASGESQPCEAWSAHPDQLPAPGLQKTAALSLTAVTGITQMAPLTLMFKTSSHPRVQEA